MRRALALVLAASIAFAACQAASRADQLADELDALVAMVIWQTLELDDQQLAALAGLAIRVRQQLDDLDRQRQQALAKAAAALADQRQALLTGDRASNRTERDVVLLRDELTRFEEAREDVLREAGDSIRDLLYPRQRALIRWQEALEEAAGLPDVEQQQLRAGVRNYALQTIDLARQLGPPQQARVVALANVFVSAFAPPGTPVHDQLVAVTLDVFRRARLMHYWIYVQQVPLLAQELADVALLAQAGPPLPDAVFSAEQVRRAISLPDARVILEEMRDGRRQGY